MKRTSIVINSLINVRMIDATEYKHPSDLLLMLYMEWDRPGSVRKGLGLESVASVPLCRLLLPFGLGRASGPTAAPGEGRREKEAEEVEGQTVSGKCCSKLFSWLRSRPDTLGVTIKRDMLPQRACRGGQLLPTDAAILDGVGSATVQTTSSESEKKKTPWLILISHK